MAVSFWMEVTQLSRSARTTLSDSGPTLKPNARGMKVYFKSLTTLSSFHRRRQSSMSPLYTPNARFAVH
jgi:hypothetical protein